MRTKLLFAAAAVAAGTVFGPVTTASAYCDPAFVEHTGYCNVCLLVAAHSHRPQPSFCPL
jgi:hypothetical protein